MIIYSTTFNSFKSCKLLNCITYYELCSALRALQRVCSIAGTLLRHFQLSQGKAFAFIQLVSETRYTVFHTVALPIMLLLWQEMCFPTKLYPPFQDCRILYTSTAFGVTLLTVSLCYLVCPPDNITHGMDIHLTWLIFHIPYNKTTLLIVIPFKRHIISMVLHTRNALAPSGNSHCWLPVPVIA